MTDRTIHYEDFSTEFEDFVKSTMQDFGAVGMSVLLVHKDRTWAQGFGSLDAIQKTPVTPQTLFYTGSTTKSFTSAMAAYLVESHDYPAIDWNTPLVQLIGDDFVLDQSSPEGKWATNHITFEDALSHRTGMPRHDMIWINGDLSDQQIVRALRHVPIQRELRAKWDYCNNMYTAVAHAVAKTLDTPFNVLLKRHIFDPLDMNSTTYDLCDAQDLASKNNDINLARGHLWDSHSKKHTLVQWEDLPSSNGAGGIISNVLDYSLWLRHLLKPTNLNAALSEQAVNAMRAPRMLLQADTTRPYVGPQAYGLGLYSQVYRGREILQHSGAISGYMVNFIIVPPTKADAQSGDVGGGCAFVTMQNSYSMAQEIVTWNLLDTLLETPELEKFDMAQVARNGQAKKEKLMRPGMVIERLFGSHVDPNVQPSLNIQSYEGIYGHTAYHELTVSSLPPSFIGDVGVAASATLYLSPSGSQKTSCTFWATLHHVSGEWWWAHRRLGPSSWITDGASKVQFVVNSGVVTGMNFQAEIAMPDELAFFRRLE